MTKYKVRFEYKKTVKNLTLVDSEIVYADSKEEAKIMVANANKGCKVLYVRKMPIQSKVGEIK